MVLMSFVNSPIVPFLQGFGNTAAPASTQTLSRHVRLLMGRYPTQRADVPKKACIACAGTMPIAPGLETMEEALGATSGVPTRMLNAPLCVVRMTRPATQMQNLFLSRAAQVGVFALMN